MASVFKEFVSSLGLGRAAGFDFDFCSCFDCGVSVTGLTMISPRLLISAISNLLLELVQTFVVEEPYSVAATAFFLISPIVQGSSRQEQSCSSAKPET
jgi:hypothetical protein